MVICPGSSGPCIVQTVGTTTVRRPPEPKERAVTGAWRIAGSRFTVPQGGRRHVRLKLTATGMRLLRRRGSLPVTIRVTVVQQGGERATRTLRARLKAPKRH
jgi:hypothetical protein